MNISTVVETREEDALNILVVDCLESCKLIVVPSVDFIVVKAFAVVVFDEEF